MNLELLESFGQNYPEEFDGALDCLSMATTCQFNRYGTLLAVGCNDGRVIIWDFITRGIAKLLSAHVHPIASVCWNRTGRKLLTASTDNNIAIWDVAESGECDLRFRFPSPVLKVQFHPRNSSKFLVCPMKHAGVLMTTEGEKSLLPADDDSDFSIAASFDRRGEYIYSGNARGKVLVIKTKNLEVVASFRVSATSSSNAAIRSIEFARRGDCFLVNTADRIIRVYESGEVLACGKDGEPEPIQKLQDLVNKTLWKRCTFSGDGEYVCAGSARQHAVYIWERSVGNLVKILHGSKGETLLDLTWHPVRPIIASISSGVVSIWAQNQVENWSAFAPDFKELDENVEYEERESEFDIEDEDKSPEPQHGDDNEDLEIDVETVDPISAFLSSDEEEEDKDALLYLSVTPDVDDPEENPFMQLPGEGREETSPPSALTRHQRAGGAENVSPTSGGPGLAGGGKKRKVRTIDIHLHNAPSTELHPLLNLRKSEKPGKRTTAAAVASSCSPPAQGSSKGTRQARLVSSANSSTSEGSTWRSNSDKGGGGKKVKKERRGK